MINFLSKTKIIVIILIIGLVVFSYFLFFNNKKAPQESVSENEVENPMKPEKTYILTPSKENSANNVYTDSQYKFSFEYPKDFTVTKFQEGEQGETILISEKETKKSFQIFIAPFDEPGPLIAERVRRDLPNIVMESPENRVLKNGAVALIFFSEESSIGKTREVWFVYGNYLYQISTYKELDGLVAAVLSTWRFQ